MSPKIRPLGSQMPAIRRAEPFGARAGIPRRYQPSASSASRAASSFATKPALAVTHRQESLRQALGPSASAPLLEDHGIPAVDEAAGPVLDERGLATPAAVAIGQDAHPRQCLKAVAHADRKAAVGDEVFKGGPQRPAAQQGQNLSRTEVVAEGEAAWEGENARPFEARRIGGEVRDVQSLGLRAREPQSLGQLGVRVESIAGEDYRFGFHGCSLHAIGVL